MKLKDLVSAIETLRGQTRHLVRYNASKETWAEMHRSMKVPLIDDPLLTHSDTNLMWGTPCYTEDWIAFGCIQAVFNDGTYTIIGMRKQDAK